MTRQLPASATTRALVSILWEDLAPDPTMDPTTCCSSTPSAVILDSSATETIRSTAESTCKSKPSKPSILLKQADLINYDRLWNWLLVVIQQVKARRTELKTTTKWSQLTEQKYTNLVHHVGLQIVADVACRPDSRLGSKTGSQGSGDGLVQEWLDLAKKVTNTVENDDSTILDISYYCTLHCVPKKWAP